MSASLYVTPYNGTIGDADAGYTTGVTDLNQFYESGDFAWIMTCAALVLLMVPGVGFFYSGLARRKSALSLIMLAMLSIAVVDFQWFFWGYSLTFSHTGSSFIGDLSNFGLMKTLAQPSVGSTKIPDLLFCLYQGMFAAITPALAIGAAVDRARVLPCIVFMFIWATIVYDPIAYWTWNANGWSFKMGGLDFAGGTPVHISSGAAALAFSVMIGKRTGYAKSAGLPYRPHNITHIVLGTVFLWVGWFGFNGGSALAANMRAVMACIVTHLAASVGGITWTLLDYRLEKKWSVVGFCSGAIAGLVAITPAAGFVTPWAAVIFGIVGGIGCNFATKLKFVMGVDEALDIFAVHGIGGIIGNLLTGLFAADYIAALDGFTEIPGGWINHNYVQLGYQIADCVAGFSYSFVLTCVILFVLNLIPGLSLRVSAENEEVGIDDDQLGEFAYDYVELQRHTSDVLAGSAEVPTPNAGRAGSSKSSEGPEKMV
ncbi:ammonium transporter [Daldinia loculata]|uniref:ammonium transporter n=1 Tax=Daldinia loculata TaxID=103429 RepID=UPI0020C478B9|nr:ammonium transporter [Daldinia loculata]KAI1642887.1 ammonium transporter [Daldinia loculata]KAI2778586.1 ammonium transporter [Daldinia loculata]